MLKEKENNYVGWEACRSLKDGDLVLYRGRVHRIGEDHMTLKEKASKAMSRYIRLRDALEYCDNYSIDITQFNRPEDIVGKCCTCGTVKSWSWMDAGHWLGRGIGGGSGTYFDERNVHLQCKQNLEPRYIENS